MANNLLRRLAMPVVATLIGTGLVAGVVGCGGNKVFKPTNNNEPVIPPTQSCVEERLNGFYILEVSPPVEYSNSLIARVANYQTRNKDIGLFPTVEGGSVINNENRLVTGFGVYAIRRGAGYSGMDKDILSLVNE